MAMSIRTNLAISSNQLIERNAKNRYPPHWKRFPVVFASTALVMMLQAWVLLLVWKQTTLP